MAPRTASELTDLITKLRGIRRHHEAALAEIESAFRQVGLSHLLESGGRKRGAAAAAASSEGTGRGVRGKAKTRGTGRGRKAAPAKGKGKTRAVAKGKRGPKAGATGGRGKRARYAQTAEEFILSFLGNNPGATTSEIRQHWQKQGRGGKAENSLTGLVKSGKVLRTSKPGQVGSSYSLPAPSSST
ncbi:hypothetical protein [Haliangium sp. UPWRP_2]|uniref:hypothetical protein n=1 Tax=Haliangium sp. UPWRP_2 TaxID=1931276 RepID=UPI000B5397E1|nr:hypothetical protein [Haliangium sp. UPWRP_2]PSM31327.1 hypothetical protein BVG81_005995 [Haliangium sp. UPWRP_2]